MPERPCSGIRFQLRPGRRRSVASASELVERSLLRARRPPGRRAGHRPAASRSHRPTRVKGGHPAAPDASVVLGPTVAHVEQAGPAPFGPSGRFAWRVVLVQLAADALVIAVLILVLPGFELHSSHKLLSVVWLAVLFGLVSALVRPALEFMLLPYVLQTLGLVLFAINAVLLALLALTPTLEIRGVGALAVGAVLAAVLGFFLTSVLGLTPPVVDATSAASSRGTPAVKLAALSERLRVMQLYGILL